jgi:1-acyl-sn-glycerol-3-phosphate acyltransferase
MEAFLRRLWNRLYDGVSFNHVETLRDVAREHEVVFVPCHRSHMDYLLLSYAIYTQGYAVPHIAAGINLNIPVIGRFLRKAGAFFIRRSFAGNALYTAVLMKYLATIMARGHSLEYFIEGGRSRTGKTLPPKLGLLSMLVDAWLESREDDAVFVPAHIAYEKIVEAQSYTKELGGAAKDKITGGEDRDIVVGDNGNVTFRVDFPVRHDGLVFWAVVPSFCSCTAGKFNDHSAIALRCAFKLRAVTATNQIFAAVLRQCGGNVL